MKTFRDFIAEAKDPKSKTYHAFDIDETLFAHDHSKLKVHLKDKSTGKRVGSLTNQEFNTHQLHPDHEYDFSDFKSSKTFQQSARPIHKMIGKLKAIHKNNKNVEMVTARQDFDDKEAFGNHMKKYGIDIGQVHVRRAGNVDPKAQPGPNKAKVISDQIKKNGYNKVHLYDDSQSNLDHFLALKDKHPDVAFHAHLVQHDPETDKVKITTTKA